jgi:hypothetical protein
MNLLILPFLAFFHTRVTIKIKYEQMSHEPCRIKNTLADIFSPLHNKMYTETFDFWLKLLYLSLLRKQSYSHLSLRGSGDFSPCKIFLNLPIIKGGRNSVQLMNTRFMGQRSSVAELIRLDVIKK